MSMMSNVGEQIKGLVSPTLDTIKKKLFGANNERLDFFMDSFYKLSPQQQSGVIIGICSALVVFMLIAVFTYFSLVKGLERELDRGFNALQQLRSQSAEYRKEKENLSQLVKNVSDKTGDLRPKVFFEKTAQTVGVTMEGLRDEVVAFPEDNAALAQNFKAVNVEFRMPKISIPKLLKFVGEIEKSDKYLKVHSMQIRARYGDRLFFETNLKITGFKPANGG